MQILSNNKPVEITEEGILIGATLIKWDEISNIEHRDEPSPAFVFNYNGSRVALPHDEKDFEEIAPFFIKEENIIDALKVKPEDVLIPVDDVDCIEEPQIHDVEFVEDCGGIQPIPLSEELVQERNDAGQSGNKTARIILFSLLGLSYVLLFCGLFKFAINSVQAVDQSSSYSIEVNNIEEEESLEDFYEENPTLIPFFEDAEDVDIEDNTVCIKLEYSPETNILADEDEIIESYKENIVQMSEDSGVENIYLKVSMETPSGGYYTFTRGPIK